MHFPCAICSKQIDFLNNLKNICITQCSHMYHLHCLITSLSSQSNSMLQCLLCNSNITKDNIFRLSNDNQPANCIQIIPNNSQDVHDVTIKQEVDEVTANCAQEVYDVKAKSTQEVNDVTSKSTQAVHDDTANHTQRVPDGAQPGHDVTANSAQPENDATASRAQPERDATGNRAKLERVITNRAQPERDVTANCAQPERDVTANQFYTTEQLRAVLEDEEDSVLQETEDQNDEKNINETETWIPEKTLEILAENEVLKKRIQELESKQSSLIAERKLSNSLLFEINKMQEDKKTMLQEMDSLQSKMKIIHKTNVNLVAEVQRLVTVNKDLTALNDEMKSDLIKLKEDFDKHETYVNDFVKNEVKYYRRYQKFCSQMDALRELNQKILKDLSYGS